MHIHILGICGTFMAGLALLARAQGYDVSGSDANCYSPMSDQLKESGIALHTGYQADLLASLKPDLVIIGNALSRGNPAVEFVLARKIPYLSGPQWLAESVLKDRFVLAVTGTHGKTTTTSLLAWILEAVGLKPGFLVGGIPVNFNRSVQMGEGDLFVIEGDEYDTAFFDKRSKFLHYHPNILIMNNLEYDHADIFPDVTAIRWQFHQLIRTVPNNGIIITNGDDRELEATLAQGCWTPVVYFNSKKVESDAPLWQARLLSEDGCSFELYYRNQPQGVVEWSLTGRHNVSNALAAIAAGHYSGIPIPEILPTLTTFRGVKRRLEIKGVVGSVSVYDDFAHHPTAIFATLQGLRAQIGAQSRLLAVIEPRSNTMRMGGHVNTLAESVSLADQVLFYYPEHLRWDIQEVIQSLTLPGGFATTLEQVAKQAAEWSRPGGHIVVMSNGDFGGMPQRILDKIAALQIK